MRKAILLSIVFLFGAASLEAAKPMALVVFASGKAELRRGEKTQKLKVRTLLEEGDVILTHDKARVSIQFSEGVISQIGAGTTIEISTLKKSGGNVEAALKMQQGSLAMSVARGGNAIQVTTPTSVAGVRGTEFIIESEEEATQVLVNEGTVNVSNGTEDEDVEAGHKVTASAEALQGGILAAFEKQKFEIIEQLKKSREKNLEHLIEQIRKNQELIQQARQNY